MFSENQNVRKYGIIVMILLIVISAPFMAYFMREGNPFTGGFEAMHSEWVSYNSPDYVSGVGTNLDLTGEGRNVYVNPDGELLLEWGGIKKSGKKTGIEANIGIPIAVNYMNGKYVQTGWEGWEPETEWEFEKDGDKYGLSVYRMMFGVRIVTASHAKSSYVETEPIAITMQGLFDLNTWDVYSGTWVGLGYMEIPTENEIDDPVLVNAVSESHGWTERLDDLLGVAWDRTAYVDAPSGGEAIDLYYDGGGEYQGGSMIGGMAPSVSIPSRVMFEIEINNINPGSIGKFWGENERHDIEVMMKIAVVILTSRKLAVPTGDPTIDKNKGGKIEIKEPLLPNLGDLFSFEIPLWMKVLGAIFAVVVVIIVVIIAVSLVNRIFRGY